MYKDSKNQWWGKVLPPDVAQAAAPQEGMLPAVAKWWYAAVIFSSHLCCKLSCLGTLQQDLTMLLIRLTKEQPQPCEGPLAELVAAGCCTSFVFHGCLAAAALISQAVLPGHMVLSVNILSQKKNCGPGAFCWRPRSFLVWVLLQWIQHPAGSCPSRLPVESELISIDLLVLMAINWNVLCISLKAHSKPKS